MEKKTANKKYLWLHKIQVLSLVYVLLSFLSRILRVSEIKYSFLLFIFVYLLFPRKIESAFQFNPRFYKLTGLLGGAASVGANRTTLDIFTIEEILLLAFMFLNSLFMLSIAFGLDLKKIANEEIWSVLKNKDK